MRLSAVNITKSFGEKEVLRGISLEAGVGKAVGLLGRNGAGKTTFMRIVMDVFPADSGELLIDGMPIKRNKISFGYLPEERGLYQKVPIIDQLVYFAVLRGMGKREARKSALELLELIGMEEYTTKRLDTLSKGNQQKIQFVAALINDPDIVILDEPFSGLDPVNAILLKSMIDGLIAKNKIVLFSSHQMNYIEEFCDDIHILNGGKLVLSGSIRSIKRSYDRSRIIINTDNREAMLDFASNRLSNLVSETSLLESGVMVKLSSPDRKNELLGAISAAGIDIDGLRVYEPSLNDIFVEYTEAGI